MVVGEHLLGKELKVSDDRMMVLREYPNSIYFHSLDFAISAAGYNTYHELMHFQVPTIFIPNEKSAADDQVTRAYNAQNHGAALVLQKPTEEKLMASIDFVLDKTTNEQMRQSAQALVPSNGAMEAAQLILGF